MEILFGSIIQITVSSSVKNENILYLTMYYMYKSFTYVTKTRPNLPTYSRKPGNYNGNIIFEIYMKSPPQSIYILIFATVKTKMLLLFWCNQLLCSVTSSVSKNKQNNLSVLRWTWTGRINLNFFWGYNINYLTI